MCFCPWYCLLFIGSVALVSSSTLALPWQLFPTVNTSGFVVVVSFSISFAFQWTRSHYTFFIYAVPCCARSSFNKRRRKPRKMKVFLNCHHTHTHNVYSMQQTSQSGNALCGFVLSPVSSCYSFSSTLINHLYEFGLSLTNSATQFQNL